MATYRLGLTNRRYISGASDGTEASVTASPSTIVGTNLKRVVLGLCANTIASTAPIGIRFGDTAEDPKGASPLGHILLPRAMPTTGFPMWSPYPGPGGWVFWGPGGHFPYCPTGIVSAVCAAGESGTVLIVEIEDPRVD